MNFKEYLKEREVGVQSYEFSINKTTKRPEFQIVGQSSWTDLVTHLSKNKEELDHILSAMNLAKGWKGIAFDSSILEKSYKEKLSYLITLISKHFPDMVEPTDLFVQSGTVRVNPEK